MTLRDEEASVKGNVGKAISVMSVCGCEPRGDGHTRECGEGSAAGFVRRQREEIDRLSRNARPSPKLTD